MAKSAVSLHAEEDFQPPTPTVNTCMKLYPFDVGHSKEFQALPRNICLKQLVL